MRQINFLLIFAVCLALVLFSLENTQPVVISIVPGFEVQAPLAIELIITMGLGGVLAWLYSVWNRLLHQLAFAPKQREIEKQNEQIQNLKKEVEHYKREMEQQNSFLPISETEVVSQS